MKRYQSIVANPQPVQMVQPVQPPQAEDDRRHLFTVEAGLILPVMQAATTAAILGGAAWALAALFEIPRPWKAGAIVGILSIVAAWLAMLWRWTNLTQPLERLLNIDLDRDGRIGPPETIRAEVLSEDKRHVTIATFPARPDAVKIMARAVMAGRPFTHKEFSGRGKLFSQGEFSTLQAEFVTRGLAQWRDPDRPQTGIELRPGGWAALRVLSQHGEIPPIGSPQG